MLPERYVTGEEAKKLMKEDDEFFRELKKEMKRQGGKSTEGFYIKDGKARSHNEED